MIDIFFHTALADCIRSGCILSDDLHDFLILDTLDDRDVDCLQCSNMTCISTKSGLCIRSQEAVECLGGNDRDGFPTVKECRELTKTDSQERIARCCTESGW